MEAASSEARRQAARAAGERRPEAPTKLPLPGTPQDTLLEILRHDDRTATVFSLQSLRTLFPESLGRLSRYRKDPDPLIQEALR